MPSSERRRHNRFTVLSEFTELVNITLTDNDFTRARESYPGIILNLSAGGMALVTFTPIKTGKKISLSLDIPGWDTPTLEGQVVRSINKSGTYLLGIEFTRIPDKIVKILTEMGEADADCNLKLSFGIKDVCSKDCSFYSLCDKKVKLK